MTALLNPQILGQAEAAHRALLDRILAGSGTTYPEWVAVALSARSPEPLRRATLRDRIATALKIEANSAAQAITGIDTKGLIETPPERPESARLSAAGRRLHDDIRQAIDAVMTRVYAGLEPADLENAGRLLLTLTNRANDELISDHDHR